MTVKNLVQIKNNGIRDYLVVERNFRLFSECMQSRFGKRTNEQTNKHHLYQVSDSNRSVQCSSCFHLQVMSEASSTTTNAKARIGINCKNMINPHKSISNISSSAFFSLFVINFHSRHEILAEEEKK